jgi:hypothetical protein
VDEWMQRDGIARKNDDASERAGERVHTNRKHCSLVAKLSRVSRKKESSGVTGWINLLLRVRTTNRTNAMPTQRRKNAKKIAFLISSCLLSLRLRHIRPGVVGGTFSLLPGWSCNHNLASAAKQT